MGYGECYNALQTFQKNKSPGNDGLTVEFYLAFWPVFGSLLVQSLNYTFEYGELSNSQKQAVITLVEKRGKDNIYIYIFLIFIVFTNILLTYLHSTYLVT